MDNETFVIPLRSFEARLELPPDVTVLEPRRLPPLVDVPAAISEALARPLGTSAFADLAREKLTASPDATAVIVVSDNTRPVPYAGPAGILWPLLDRLLRAGFAPERITVLVASGTHRRLSAREIETLFDPRVAASGVAIRCHDAFDPAGLVPVGSTDSGREVMMDRRYVEADLRILTGLVESHLMAGASGGRKSICPGLVGIDSIRDFHGPTVLADPRATDLATSSNPCHELSLQIARLAPADFILNVTARENGAVMGVFAGDMERAHEQAVEQLRDFVAVPLRRKYDIVVTHAAKVGVNHYQAAKAACVAARAVKAGGHVILIADTIDPDPIGSIHYRALMTLLKDIGHEAFERLIRSPDWTFVPDQWQVQMWDRVFGTIPPDRLHYYSPQTPLFEYDRLPGRSPRYMWERLAAVPEHERTAAFVKEALSAAVEETVRAAVTALAPTRAATGVANAPTRTPATAPRVSATVAFLPAGPYGIPVESGDGIEG